jgi:proline iminopeptidase
MKRLDRKNDVRFTEDDEKKNKGKEVGYRSGLVKLRFATSILVLVPLFCISSLFASSDDDPSKLNPGDHYAPIVGVQLHYRIAGQGPLVLVTSPGWGIGSTYLQNGLAPLEEHFTMLFLDTRGSGKSTRPIDDKQMGTAVMADDLEALRRYLGLKSLCLVGHSGGGTIVLEYAERYPNPEDKIVLLDPGILGDEATDTTRHTLDLWRDDPRYHQAVISEEKNEDISSDEAFAQMLGEILPLYFSDPDRYVLPFSQTYADTHLSAWAERTHDADDALAKRAQSQDYPKVVARTLIMNGTVDWICPPEPAQRAHAGIKGSQLSLYANAGHVLWIEQPQRFFTEITRFLEK